MKRSLPSLLGILLLLGSSPLYSSTLFAQDDSQDTQDANNTEQETDLNVEDPAPAIHAPVNSPFLPDHLISVTLQTTRGELCCDLHPQDHPMTVINFLMLANAPLPWLAGVPQKKAFYENLPADNRERNSFVVYGEDTKNILNYTIADERCTKHPPLSGALGMVQNSPGQSRSAFFILAKDMPIFEGMFPIFGSCKPIEIIQELSNHKSELVRIVVHDRQSCASPTTKDL